MQVVTYTQLWETVNLTFGDRVQIRREAYYITVVGFFVAKFAEYPSPGESGGGKGVGMVHKKNRIKFYAAKNQRF